MMEVNASELPSLLPAQPVHRQPEESSSNSLGFLDDNDTTTPQSSPETPKPQPTAFTIDFGGGKPVDKSRLEHLAKQSQARHQRVQSMSAGLQRPNATSIPQKPPLSAKLPRKAQGYNSEGYFSSDQEDSLLSGSVKLKQSPLAQSTEVKTNNFVTSPIFDKSRAKQAKSPTDRTGDTQWKSKSPIVDSIMSRSDTLPSRQSLILPLKNTNTSSYHDVHSPNYSTLSSSYQSRHLSSIIDQSPDGIMLTDISSPEFDLLTPDNGVSSPEHKRSPKRQLPDLFVKCLPKNELEILEDADMHSNNSSTGTYTIEADSYTVEQKARMSIDKAFGVDLLRDSINEALESRSSSIERDPELVVDAAKDSHVCLRSPDAMKRSFEIPKVSADKNVLEITCGYESPTEDLAAQTSKQIKSTRNYLEKIKNRVRTISEKTFQKSPPKIINPQDEGSFTSVTTSGVLAKQEPKKVRRLNLSKCQTDRTEYVHRLTRESSVPVSLPNGKKLPLEEANFESAVMRNAQSKVRDDSGICDATPDQIVGRLSYLSLNRCKGDKTWIQEWAESVKKYNNDTLALKPMDLNGTFAMVPNERPPASPRHATQIKSTMPVRSGFSSGTPSKIPSPISSTYHSPRAVQETSSDTATYLLKTQNAITNLQARLHAAGTAANIPPALTSSLISEKTAASRLPVSQLSRSNSLNYRLKRRELSDNSPLRSPGHYVITGSTAMPAGTRILLSAASKSLDADSKHYGSKLDSNMNSPTSDRGTNSSGKTISNSPHDAALSPRRHARHKSFDGRNACDYFDCDNAMAKVSLKTVLKNNAFEAQNAYATRLIEPTRCQGDVSSRNHVRVYSDGRVFKDAAAKPFASSIRRSSSFNTVNRNNNIEPNRALLKSDNHRDYLPDYLSDESDNASYPDVKQPEPRYNRALALRRDRLESPELKSIAPANSPRCPNTPELARKFGPGLVRNSTRVTNKDRPLNSRLSEPPRQMDREKPLGQPGKKISDTTRQAIVNRLTKSRSSTREFQPKKQEKGGKKPNQHLSSSSLASKELEFTNWKKRSSYDPMKAALEGRNRKKAAVARDALASPTHSSPVHRSQSFHSTNMAALQALDYSSEETEDDQRVSALPMESAMITSTHSEILRPRAEYREALRRDYLTSFHVNQPSEKLNVRRDSEKRKTFIIDGTTPTKGSAADFYKHPDVDSTFAVDKRGIDVCSIDQRGIDRGMDQRGIDQRGIDHRGMDQRGIDQRVMDQRSIDQRGVDQRGMDQRGIDHRGIGQCGIDQRGIDNAGRYADRKEEHADKRKTFIIEDEADKRKTFILDSDTNSTTNGSSPRNSSIFSHEKASLTTGTSDTEGESGTESAPVVMRHPAGRRAVPPQPAVKRHSGDYSVSSSTTSAGRESRGAVQPRYLDISRYKGEPAAKNPPRRELGRGCAGAPNHVTKGSARHVEMEQKKAELEKWKRRASYDPRKSAALAKTSKTPTKSTSVLRSQSFHGPVLAGCGARYTTASHHIPETYDGDYTSDNDF